MMDPTSNVQESLVAVFQAEPTVAVGHRLALEKATKNAELSEQLGLPLTPGPWYNASIGLTHRDNMANCQFTLLGSKHSSDIYMRVGTPHSSCYCRSFQMHMCLPGLPAGCEDQGASKYLAVQSDWSSQLGGASHGSFSLSWRWPVTQYQPYRHCKATQGRGCQLIRHFAAWSQLVLIASLGCRKHWCCD